ncbi:hypothetical protein Tco_1163043 [Tanacetum coccineum]
MAEEVGVETVKEASIMEGEKEVMVYRGDWIRFDVEDSPSTSSKDGEDWWSKLWRSCGAPENNSSMGSRLMARGDVSLDGWVGVGGGEVKGGGVDLGVGGDEVRGLLKQHGLTLILAVGLSAFEKLIRSFSEERSNKNSIKVLFLRSTTPFDCGVRGAEKLCVMPLASQKALNCTSLSNSRP